MPHAGAGIVQAMAIRPADAMSCDGAAAGAAQAPCLRIRLFGAFELTDADGHPIEITSRKTQALLALLATAPSGRRTRSWLQDMLWSRADPEHGRASLRQAVRQLRLILDESFEDCFVTSKEALQIRLDRVLCLGVPSDGDVLEGLDIDEEGFSDWLREWRLNPQAHDIARPRAPAEPLTHVPSPLTPTTVRGTVTGGSRVLEPLLPTVLVLPFAAMRPDGGKEALVERAFGDVMALDISRTLSRSRLMSVISHLSARSIRRDDLGLTDIQELLQADYVADGTVHMLGDAYRLDVDLIDAATGALCWSERFSGRMTGYFAGDEGLTHNVADRISMQIISAAIDAFQLRSLPDLDSHQLMMSGVGLMYRTSRESFLKARTCLKELAKRATNDARPQVWLAKWHVLNVQQGWTRDIGEDAEAARHHLDHAFALNTDASLALAIDGFVHNNLLQDFEGAMTRFDAALEQNNSNALAWLLKGTLHAFMGEGELAVRLTDRARALSPVDPYRFFFEALSAAARLAHRDYEGALLLADSSRRLNPRHTSTLRARTIALQRLGRHDEARTAAGELLRLEPRLRVDAYLRSHPAARSDVGKDWAAALNEAGIP